MSGMTCDPPGVRAAVAVRRLGHELVNHRPDATILDRVAALAQDLATAVAATPLRPRPHEETLERLAQPVPPDGTLLDHGSVCPVSGAENPLGPAMAVWREGDAVRATVILGPAHAGSRGIAHGGVIAALFDDLMGFVMDSLAKTQGFTASLTVSYRRPVPIGTEIDLRGRLQRTQGRKLFIVATMELAGAMLAEAEALFVGVAPPSDGRPGTRTRRDGTAGIRAIRTPPSTGREPLWPTMTPALQAVTSATTLHLPMRRNESLSIGRTPFP